ncbi:SRPBCC family protein [Solirubrobacter phytolaccae]|uniref:SRPBCC family protein n=1 Tax=Solirubrobacter phytolaccae TaxID=1404360 RepID=A0A9X3S6A8_9ACTN|nr:SRPBCC family protein [Solirubrobacter phytolaccae]MDA0179719.1 SRPBCC family protein [Solirubrobacter phytolaccae]
MRRFTDEIFAAAPIEELWKLVVDPSRYPEWWSGIASVRPGGAADEFALFHPEEPELPWPQRLEAHDGQVLISCLTSAIRYAWRLTSEDGGTRVAVDVEIPDDWAEHEASQRALIGASLPRLVAVATG